MAILRRDDLKNVRMSEPPCFLFLFSLRAPRRGLPVARRLPLIVSKPQPLAELLSQRDGRAAILRLRIRKRSQPQVLWAESVAEEEEAAAEGARAGTRAAREAATGRSMQSEEDIGTDSHGAALSTTPATKRKTLFVDRRSACRCFQGLEGRDGFRDGVRRRDVFTVYSWGMVGLLRRPCGALGTFIDDVESPRAILLINVKEAPECGTTQRRSAQGRIFPGKLNAERFAVFDSFHKHPEAVLY